MAVVLRPGEVIAGKYRVLHEIGRGGMGVVVAADHLLLPQQVAIKLLKRDADAVSLARFEREANVVVQLHSEHVCRVLDVGALEGGEPFIVMELLHGCDLATLIGREGPLRVSRAVDFLLQVCDALAEAHVRGVVHRDLKPSNLFLTEGFDGSPLVKVLDFGISKAGAEESNRGDLTESGTILGSPRFMAPEQLLSARKIDHRTDVWALGVVLHELLTGRPAFEGDTAPELFVSILQGEPRPIGEIAPQVPEALAEVMLRCTRKRMDDRYANVGALALALARFAPPTSSTIVERIVRTLELHGWTVMSSEVVAPADATREPVDESAATVAASDAQRPAALPAVTGRAPSTRGARGLWIGLTAGVALTLLLVGGVVMMTMRRDGADPLDGDGTLSERTTAPTVSASPLPPQTCYFELCDPDVTVPIGVPVEPEVLLPTAQRRAKQLEPEAALVNISTTPIVGGVFRKGMPGSINYIFRYPNLDGTHATVHIGIGPTMLFGRHGPDLVGHSYVEPPRCPLQKALVVAQQAGLEPTKEIIAVWGAFGPKWMLNQTSPPKVLGIDGDCRETPLVP
jgi:eukaryotic-like serine/threonine-protein kinase